MIKVKSSLSTPKHFIFHFSNARLESRISLKLFFPPENLKEHPFHLINLTSDNNFRKMVIWCMYEMWGMMPTYLWCCSLRSAHNKTNIGMWWCVWWCRVWCWVTIVHSYTGCHWSWCSWLRWWLVLLDQLIGWTGHRCKNGAAMLQELGLKGRNNFHSIFSIC